MFTKQLEIQAKRSLKLSRRPGEVRRRKGGIRRTADVVSILARYRPEEIGSAIDLIDILHICVVEQVKGFHACLGGEALPDMEGPLEADVAVII